jgi:hypothetical protein
MCPARLLPKIWTRRPVALRHRSSHDAKPARGLTNGEIAERLFLSSHTIKTHINRILVKIGSRDRVAAIG